MIATLGTAPGCDPDRREPCEGLYDHLVQIANRRQDAALKREFVTLCVETWDDKRSACLQAATTPKAAMKCKPEKVHPG